MNIINPYRFAGAGAATPLPTHWWDLDDDGAWADQGEKAAAGWDLTELGTPVTTSSTIGSGGSRTVVDFDGGDGLEFNNGGTKTVVWDGDNDLISVACWANADVVATSGNWLMSWRQSSSNRLLQLELFNDTTDHARSDLWDDAQTLFAADDDEGDAPISTSTWYHICTTFDGSDVKLYVDGTLVETTDASSHSGAFMTGASPFAIGVAAFNKTNSGFYHNGKMHAAGIWDVALTADDVATLYNNGDGGSYSEIFA